MGGNGLNPLGQVNADTVTDARAMRDEGVGKAVGKAVERKEAPFAYRAVFVLVDQRQAVGVMLRPEA